MTEFEIDYIDMTERREVTDYKGHDSSSLTRWEGVIKVVSTRPVVKYKFEFEKFRTEDNGGETARILDIKPKELTLDEWDDLKDEMTEFIENEYRENRRDWEELE